MKISSFLSLFLLVLALVSVGCSASGRVSVKSDSATVSPTDVQIAYVNKQGPAPH
jgi:hypothetical protein